MVSWINVDDSGFVVQSFETSGVGGSLDGYSVAHLLSSELQRIQKIDEKATEVVIFTGFDYTDQGPNGPEDTTRRTYSTRSGDGTTSQTQSIPSLSEPEPISDYSIISLKGDSLKYTISGMGSLGIGGTLFSPGNLLLFLKEIKRYTPSPITGSIQRYNSTIIIVATLEDHKSDKLFTWEVRRNITENNASLYEQIPSMIRDLSFQIAPDLGRLRQPEIYYPQSWQALKFQTQAQESYLSYNRTLNISYLDLASYWALAAVQYEHSYDKPTGMLSEIGFFYLEHNGINQAEGIFSNLEHIHPFQGTMGLGAVYSREGRYAEAEKEFDEAIKLNRKSIASWYNKGFALYNQGKYDEAINAYDEAIRLDPNLASAWNGKGVALDNQGKYDEAIKALNESIRLDPNDAYAWNNKGNALNHQGQV